MEHGKDLSGLNTFGLSVKADRYEEVATIEDMIGICRVENLGKSKHLILGGGSNILFTRDFQGLVIRNRMMGFEEISRDDDSVLVKIGAGENWHKTVLNCLSHQFGGIENLSLIPGSVGAAPIQNIGAYGVELDQVFHSLEWISFDDCSVRTFNKEDCDFGYRDSIFKRKLKGKGMVASIMLQLSLKPTVDISYGAISEVLENRGIVEPTIHDVSEAVIEIRQSKLPDPADIGNSGSFFKNPVISKTQFDLLKSDFPEMPGYPNDKEVKVPAGWLIESAGWKGFKRGSVGVHDRQALVLVNLGGATGEEVRNLAYEIQNSIFKKFKIELEPEVNMI